MRGCLGQVVQRRASGHDHCTLDDGDGAACQFRALQSAVGNVHVRYALHVGQLNTHVESHLSEAQVQFLRANQSVFIQIVLQLSVGDVARTAHQQYMLHLCQVHCHLLRRRSAGQPCGIEPLSVLGTLYEPVVRRSVEPEVEGRALRGVCIVLLIHDIATVIQREGVRQRSGTVTQFHGALLLPVRCVVELGHRVERQWVQPVEVTDVACRPQLVTKQSEVGCRRCAE